VAKSQNLQDICRLFNEVARFKGTRAPLASRQVKGILSFTLQERVDRMCLALGLALRYGRLWQSLCWLDCSGYTTVIKPV